MKILMFGWEFPPFNTGGLGTACYNLTKSLAKNNIDITFVLPKVPEDVKSDWVKIISAGNISNIKIQGVITKLSGYITSESYSRQVLSSRIPETSKTMYGKDLFEEVYRYSIRARQIAKDEAHDIIHCHDWMTYQAGKHAKSISGKPLVLHVHATEFDRTGGNVNQAVFEMEREGMHAADAIIAVSNFTKAQIVQHYGIDPTKVFVVHNSIDVAECSEHSCSGLKNNHKVVLFLGRVTLQKGPDYFLYAAKKVLEHEPDARFIIAGSGDMAGAVVEKAAHLGIADKVLFTGFLRGPEIEKAYRMADVYVMPSVSEPFGLTALEAMGNKTPVIISKQSGVSEVVGNCLKVDFWDTDRMANNIVAVLRYNAAYETLRDNGYHEVRSFSWDKPAKKCIDIYNMLGGH